MRNNRQKKPAEAGFFVSQAIKSLDLNGEMAPAGASAKALEKSFISMRYP
ncbi:hypothetical protein SAMN04488483_0259 [Pseudomonas helmanticensis]|uniref:Uncharacterized protein n=1 Tax=Pseudomonas helmanticensis TaxID=1471381 RepID=A0ACD2TZH2_9PSED|nr:hypothetical protein SAMN04488483_0259 [Pseudomonas helmanticensis]